MSCNTFNCPSNVLYLEDMEKSRTVPIKEVEVKYNKLSLETKINLAVCWNRLLANNTRLGLCKCCSV